MPEANILPMTVPFNGAGSQYSDELRRKILAAQLLQRAASDSSQPVYTRGHGYAKLASGLLGGVLEGYEEGKARSAEKQGWKDLLDLQYGKRPESSPASPASSASPSIGGAQANPAQSDSDLVSAPTDGVNLANLASLLMGANAQPEAPPAPPAPPIQSAPMPPVQPAPPVQQNATFAERFGNWQQAPQGGATAYGDVSQPAPMPPAISPQGDPRLPTAPQPDPQNPAYLAALRRQESGGNDAARAPTSSATGRYQFTSGTWNDLARANPQLGLTPDGRTDPAQQERAIPVFTAQNAQALQRAGIEPTPGNLYMAHFLGTQGGPAFLQAMQQNPNAPATSLVSPQVAQANQSVFFNRDGTPRSAGEVYQLQTRQFSQAPTQPPQQMAQAAPPQPAPQLAPQAQTPAPQPRVSRADVERIMMSDAPPHIKQAALQFLQPGSIEAFDPEKRYARRGRDGSLEWMTIPGQGGGGAPAPNIAIPAAPPGANEKKWRETYTESAAKRSADSTGSLPSTSDEAMKLRKEFGDLPSYKNLAQTAPVYKSMVEAAGRDNRASDVNMIYGMAKLMDPGSVVREGEMTIAQAIATLPQQLRAGVESQLSGSGRLTPEVREAIMGEAYSRVNAYRSMFDQDASMYKGIAERSRMNVEDVIPQFKGLDPYKSAKSDEPVNVTSPDDARKLPNGTRIILPDGSPGVVR